MSANDSLIEELMDQIVEWQREIDTINTKIDKYDEKVYELEDKIDKAYWRIQVEKGEEVENVKGRLKLVFSRD